MNKNDINKAVYNEGAEAMAVKFNNIGPRVKDVMKGFELLGKNTGKVVELGCGNGRDAREILKYTNDFIGMDISEEMIKLAREYNPGARFEVGTIEEYEIPKGTDIIFAFASLLHLSKEEVKDVLKKAYLILNERGIFFISVKKDVYHEKLVENEYGKRVFYFYELKDFEEMSEDIGYSIVFHDEQKVLGVDWLTVGLKK